MRVPIKVTAMIYTMAVTVAGVVYAFMTKDTTITVVGLGIIGGVIGANAICDHHDRINEGKEEGCAPE